MARLQCWVAVGLVLGPALAASPVFADEGVPPPPPPYAQPPQPPQPQPAMPTGDEGVHDDASATSTWFAPTALTPPAGTWSVSNYELFLISASYAPSDRLHLSALTLVPVSNQQPFWGVLSAKYQLVHEGRLRLAAHGAVTVVSGDNDDFSAGAVGGVATGCLDARCDSYVTGYAAAGFARSDQSAVPLLLSGSAVFRLGRHIRAMGELNTAAILGNIHDTSDAYLFWYGLRFTSSAIGVDVGFVKPIVSGTSSDDDVFPIGFPIVSVTYRGLPGE